MRRALSILLILVFAAGPLSAALPGSEDANLPPCCRRHGAHHCAMAMRMAAMMARDSRPAFSAPLTCPYYPGLTATILTPPVALAATAAQLPELLPVSTRPLLTLHATVRSLPSRTHAGRGPPAEQLS